VRFVSPEVAEGELPSDIIVSLRTVAEVVVVHIATSKAACMTEEEGADKPGGLTNRVALRIAGRFDALWCRVVTDYGFGRRYETLGGEVGVRLGCLWEGSV
jgi:hypothetical protein